MTPAADTLGLIAATLLMILAGMSKKLIEWKPRHDLRRRRPKPPRDAP